MPIQLDSSLREQIIINVNKRLEDEYVFPELGQRMAQALRERLSEGAYDQFTDGPAFCEELTNDMRAICHDLHVRMVYHDKPQPPYENQYDDPEAMRIYWASSALKNHGFHKVERLAGNVGYIQFTALDEAEETSSAITAAMNFVANTHALILDIRKHTGGAPTGVAFLCSYLFGPTPVHLCDVYIRKGNLLQQSWTFPYVPGKRYLDKPVYVLTSARTPSAAEELAYDLKHLKRALIVGETTAGGAHLVDVFQLHPQFDLRLSTGRAQSPVTGTNWEGVGVIPDISVPQQEAFEVAYKHALQSILSNLKEAQTETLVELRDEVQQTLDQQEQTNASDLSQ